MAPWLAFVEAYLVKRLLQSQAFHRGVHKVHRGVQRMRNGAPPEELGSGTNLEKPEPGFVDHFWDELRGQARRQHNTPTTKPPTTSQNTPQPEQKTSQPPPSQADPIRHDQPSGGFLSHFTEELRSQFRRGDKRP